MTDHVAQKNIYTISDFTKCCYIVMISHVIVVGLIDIKHMQSVIKGFFFFFFFFFFFQNCYYFRARSQNPVIGMTGRAPG